jgi:hypothetical protein
MRKIIYLLLIVTLIYSCKKSEIEQVPFNEPPPDHTISNVTIENYITRTYILTLGREPDSVEFSSAKVILTTSNLDSSSRQIFLNTVFSNHDFRIHVYEENKNKLLNFADTVEFSHWIYLFNLFLQDTSQQTLWPYFQYEKDRMVEMQNAYSDYVNDSIEVNELHRRLCNNYLYDQINMGSANFVISTFMQLINRNPTTAEQQAGVSMVEGHNAILFLQSGSSKDDYLNIFTSSPNYYEGQVVFMYLKYLNRNPTTSEMSDGTLKYSSTNDYTAVQKDILSTDEFIGL